MEWLMSFDWWIYLVIMVLGIAGTFAIYKFVPDGFAAERAWIGMISGAGCLLCALFALTSGWILFVKMIQAIK